MLVPDPISIQQILSLGAALQIGGPILAVLVIWYFGDKSRERDLRAYREDTMKILAAYQNDMVAMRQMYENNVVLVKGYEALANSLKDVVVLNTTAITRQCDLISNNQYCPNVRLRKEAPGAVR